MAVSGISGATAIGKGGGIRWLSNPFFGSGGQAVLILKMEAGLAAVTRGFGKDVQDYAQEHAPWEDRTGEARQGLTAKAEQRLTRYTITLFHTVEYGIWLEVRWDGKYAIILPTIEHMGHELMDRLQIALIANAAGGLI